MAPDSRCKHHIFQQVSLQADKDEHVLSAQPGNTRLSARVRVPDASKYQCLSFSRYIQTVWMSRILQKVVYKAQKQHILIMWKITKSGEKVKECCSRSTLLAAQWTASECNNISICNILLLNTYGRHTALLPPGGAVYRLLLSSWEAENTEPSLTTAVACG